MNITYKPYIRDSSFKELSIKSPTINIKGYKPKYTIKQDKEEAVIPVESPIEEIRVFKNSEINKAKTNTKKFESKEDFKDTMIPIYESLLIKRGLNPVFAKALVAQDGLESAWGSKPSGNFNFGGIKGKGSIKRTREVINGKDVYINDSFRDFNSLEDYANFKIDLLNSNRYNAFSGNISEFADRVQKGGYATDPNYSRTLNKVIATAKHGGTLKLQLGGVVQGKQWVKNWYKNRTFQIKRNIQQHQLIPIPVTGALGYNILAHNIDLTTASIDPSKVPTDSKGVYSYRGRKIYLRDDSPSTAVHEWGHSSRPDPQVKEIARIKNLLGDAFYDQNSVIPDDYLDDPQEIYARLMQFRYALGVDPNHKFTNKEIEDLKKKDSTLFAELGLKVPKYQNSGVLRNAYNDPEEMYDYSAGQYDFNENHGRSRDPETGLVLKNLNHPTAFKSYDVDNNLGYKWYKSFDGRIYSKYPWESITDPFLSNSTIDREDISHPVSISGFKNIEEVYNYLINLGASKEQAAGLVGVFIQESGLNHNSISSAGAKGIAQLKDGKYNKYKKWLKDKPDTWQNQLTWLWDHINNGSDDWQIYYDSLKSRDYKTLTDKEKNDWNSMKNSKWTKYSYTNLRNTWNSLKNPGEIAELFTWTFERPREDEAKIDQRWDYAQQVYNKMNK